MPVEKQFGIMIREHLTDKSDNLTCRIIYDNLTCDDYR